MLIAALLLSLCSVLVPVIGFVATQRAADSHMEAMDRYEAKIVELEAIVARSKR